MNIDANLMHRLEKLSKIELSEEKRGEVQAQLSEIVNFVENLSSLDTSNIEGTFTTLSGGTPLREDEPQKSSVRDDILKFAPKSEDNFFVVPKIIE